MSIKGEFNKEKCSQRSRIAAGRFGVDAFPLRLKTAGESSKFTQLKSVGSVPDSPEASIRLINALLPEGVAPLAVEDVYIHLLEAANSNFIGDRFMYLHDTTLKNIAKGAKTGISFMNSHRTGGLSSPAEMPFGQSFAGLYEQGLDDKGNPVQRSTIAVYMLRDLQPNGENGPSTDALNRMMESGSLKDVSVGLSGGERICDVCGNDVNDYDKCAHIPGTTQEMTPDEIKSQKQRDPQNSKGVATYSLFGADFSEISAVYDGAVPGAGVKKVLNFARQTDLSREEVRAFLQDAFEQYGAILPFDLSEVVEVKPEPRSARETKPMNPLLLKVCESLGISVDANGQLSENSTPPVVLPPVAPPQPPANQESAETLALRQEVAKLRATRAASFAQLHAAKTGGEKRVELEKQLAELHLQAQANGTADVLENTFSLLSGTNLGGVLPMNQLDGATTNKTPEELSADAQAAKVATEIVQAARGKNGQPGEVDKSLFTNIPAV